MIGSSEKEGEFNFADIVDFLNQYKKPIIGMTLLAGLVALIFSSEYFIPPKYKSSVILYPTRTNSISRSLFGFTSDQHDILAFGEEQEAEQLLQILESDEITERIALKYGLMKHYHIDQSSGFPRTALGKEFKENVKFRRTEYMSIEITTLDINRDTAAKMANDIAMLLDSVKTRIQQERAKEVLSIVQREYDAQQLRITTVVDSLRKLGAYGVQNYVEQAPVLTEQYARARMMGNNAVAKEIGEQEKMLATYGPIHQKLMNELNSDVNQLTVLEEKLSEAKVDAQQRLSHKFVINNAVPAERKSYPVRSLIVLVAMVSTLICSILVFAILSNYTRSRRRKEFIKQEEKLFAEV